MEKIGVIGCGAWATTVGKLLAEVGHDTTLYCHREAYVDAINGHHHNPFVLDNVLLPTGLKATLDITRLHELSCVVVGVPSQFLIETLAKIRPFLPEKIPILSLVKGVVQSEKLFVCAAIEDMCSNPVAVLSGPNLAREIALGKPAATVVASRHKETALWMQHLLDHPLFRVYTSDDVRGVELGGVFKNMVALAAGICDGLALGANAKSALITRSIYDLFNFSSVLGGKKETFFGLSGMGDLMATCFSQDSRNWQMGYKMGQGQEWAKIGSGVAEGVRTLGLFTHLAHTHHLDTPIIYAVQAVVAGEKKPEDAIKALLSRQVRSE